MYSMVTIVNNTLLYTWKMLRIILNLLTTQRQKVIMSVVDINQSFCSNHFYNIYMYQCTLKLRKCYMSIKLEKRNYMKKKSKWMNEAKENWLEFPTLHSVQSKMNTSGIHVRCPCWHSLSRSKLVVSLVAQCGDKNGT